jgi:transposase
MTVDFSKVRIFIRPGYTDLRKAVNGLAVLVEEQMAGEPFSGNVYMFCNRDRRLLKALYWDRTGFWLSQKRLEKDRYPWPETKEAVEELNGEELSLLLRGIDLFKAHKPLFYKKVS